MKALQHSSQNRAGSPNIYIGSSRRILPPWSGRAGAPGEGQSCPTQPFPRQLQGVMEDLPSCNNNWNGTTIGRKPNKSPKSSPLFTRPLHSIFVFNLSIYRFILNVSYSLPENIFAILPRKALLRQSTAERKKERKGERKINYCCTIPFIKFARFRSHLNRLNKLKNYLS